jgi:16S rRNA (guanine(966)-N(2))-methyltransferase RsmD
VRIIGGRLRRTPIAVVAVPGLRPTPDRVRETLFNWLEHLLGDWSGVRVLDLFAGSGVLGFECASRGALHVTLVESHPRAAAALHELQSRLNCTAVQIVQDDWLAATERLASAELDLVFLDPPFGSDLLPRAIAAGVRLLRPGGLLYVESGQVLAEQDLAQWPVELVRSGQAGAVFYHLLRTRSC